MPGIGMTLTRFIIEQQRQHEDATGELSILLSQIAVAAKIVAAELRRAGLAGITGYTGEVNIQGEKVKKLDQWSNEVFMSAMEYSQLICELVSEEVDTAVQLHKTCQGRKYSLSIDPVDGSSNIDINGVVGTIFSVHRRRSDQAAESDERDLLQKGSAQVAAGYVMYGPSTILVYTTGDGVNGFTLDPDIGEFILSHEGIRIPERGNTYAVNVGNYYNWFPETQKLVDYLNEHDAATNRPYSLRYVGSLCADLHRVLLEGGLYLYPSDQKKKAGKLRLLYECAPLSMVAEQAGGLASTGTASILDIEPTSIHQRVPLIIGSPRDVELALSFFRSASA